MIKKITALSLILLIQFTTLAASAKTIRVKSLTDFDSLNPPKYYSVEVLDAFYVQTENAYLQPGYILNGYIAQVIPPKRLKQDATFVYVPTVYMDTNNKSHPLKTVVGARTTKVNTTELVVSSALALTVGIVPALLAVPGFFAAEGACKAKDGEKVKASVGNAYKKSFLSLGEKGKNIHIKRNEEFLLNIALINSQEPNYSYSQSK